LFLRVRDFGTVERQRFPEPSTAGRAFAVVAAAAADIEGQVASILLMTEEGTTAKAAARAALVRRLAAIARTARLVARTVPGAADGFHLSPKPSDVALLAVARAFVREGQAAKDQLVPLGLPETFITDVQVRIDRFEQAIRNRRAATVALASAHAAIATAVAQGFDAVRTLDVVIANTMEDDPLLLNAWRRDRRVRWTGKAPAGTPRSRATSNDAAAMLSSVAAEGRGDGAAAPEISERWVARLSAGPLKRVS
jgi:hypothetical protein